MVRFRSSADDSSDFAAAKSSAAAGFDAMRRRPRIGFTRAGLSLPHGRCCVEALSDAVRTMARSDARLACFLVAETSAIDPSERKRPWHRLHSFFRDGA
jgi:hypothetical protein